MEIIRINHGKMKLILDADDMKRHGIKSSELSADTAVRRRVLWSLLDEVKEKTGLEAAGGRTLLEAFPDKLGGCEIFVTLLCTEEEREAAFFRFSSFADLAAAVARLEDGGLSKTKSALYMMGEEGYFLFLSLPKRRGERTFSPYHFLEEYGERVRSVFYPAYVREYGTCLCERDAFSYILAGKDRFSV